MAIPDDVGKACLLCNDKCCGFQMHKWRNLCLSCDCPADQHDVYDDSHKNLLYEMNLYNHKQANQYLKALDLSQRLGFYWLPIGVDVYEVEQFLSSLPSHLVPKISSNKSFDIQRSKRMRIQCPPRDRRTENLREVTNDEERSVAENFFKMRNLELFFGTVSRMELSCGVACEECDELIGFGDYCVKIDPSNRHKPSMVWHPRCFNCHLCKDLLIDYLYGKHGDQVYCQRHFVQQLRPRCKYCDELIFCNNYTKTMEQEAHSSHFSCKKCEKSLMGQRYILKEEQPYCLQCYEEVFANTCEECKEKIGCDSKDMSFKERHWHEKCFKCSECQNSLVDKPFATKDELLFCSDCYDNKFASRCDACSNVFKAGMRKYEYRGKQWHEECFTCLECKQPIGAKSFIPREQNVVCVPCYEEKYAQRCNKCTQVIRRGGVTYKGEPWHKECFTCTNCDKQLAGVKFTSKDEKPYCSDCYGELFAKKCCKCSKPITGFGGCKFISFEERHWHSECFSCNKCECNLVGRGFLTHEDRIICPDCGR